MAAGAAAGTFLLSAVIALLLLSRESLCEDKKNPQAAMYTILHDLALPHLDKHSMVTERFVLLQPGEVLNPHDYMPVSESTKVFKNPLQLPPDENMFKLSDVVPSLSALSGGKTGKSLSTIYSNILYSIDTTTVKEDPFTNENYIAASKYLQTQVADPAGEKGSTVSRSELYQRYKENYYDARQMVSMWIEKNKTVTPTELEYEEWYKASYDTLEAITSNAYSQWLSDGMKGEVEDRLSVVDIKSVRSEIEDARNILRNEERPSRDGSSKYYPVHYVPSNWHKYLLARPSQLTQSQIRAKINLLETQKLQLTSMMISKLLKPADIKVIQDQSKNAVKKKQGNLADSTTELSCFEYLCLCTKVGTKCEESACFKKYKPSDPCKELKKKKEDCEKKTSDILEAQTLSEDIGLLKDAHDMKDKDMNTMLKKLENQINQLKEELKTAPKTPTKSEDSDESGSDEMTQEDLEKNWMCFSYDSQSSETDKVQESSSYQLAAKASVSSFFRSFSASGSYSKAEQSFAESMSKRDVSVSAKLLRVSFSRSWFQPSIFSLRKLKMQSEVSSPVSPGPMMAENDYVQAASSKSYQLPEYTTGFLLAKDVKMQFSGVDSATASHAIQQSAAGSLSFSLGPFKAKGSFSAGHKSSSLKVSTSANSLQIEVPGAQIIGYYTSVLPKFPS